MTDEQEMARKQAYMMTVMGSTATAQGLSHPVGTMASESLEEAREGALPLSLESSSYG